MHEFVCNAYFQLHLLWLSYKLNLLFLQVPTISVYPPHYSTIIPGSIHSTPTEMISFLYTPNPDPNNYLPS